MTSTSSDKLLSLENLSAYSEVVQTIKKPFQNQKLFKHQFALISQKKNLHETNRRCSLVLNPSFIFLRAFIFLCCIQQFFPVFPVFPFFFVKKLSCNQILKYLSVRIFLYNYSIIFFNDKKNTFFINLEEKQGPIGTSHGLELYWPYWLYWLYWLFWL